MTIPIRGDHPPIDDELLSAYLDGQVSSTERAAVEAAIATDPAVRARLNDLRATVTLLRALPQPAPRRTFILTPEQAAAIRPRRVPLLTRLFPAIAAVSAVAAVLCLMLIAGDLVTGGFGAKQATPPARSAIEVASSAVPATAAPAIPAAPTAAPTVAAAPAGAASGQQPAPTSRAVPVATTAPAPAVSALPAATATRTADLFPAATSAGSGASNLAPTAAGGVVSALPAGTSAPTVVAAAPTTAPTVAPTAPVPAPTVVANIQPTAPAVTAPVQAPGGAVVSDEKGGVPVALIRAAEIVLGLLAVAGIVLAILSWRSRSARS